MAVTFQLPAKIEESLRHELGDLDQAAKEAALIELYRQHKVTHYEFSQALGLSRFQTEAMLKKHGVTHGFCAEDVLRESQSLRPESKR